MSQNLHQPAFRILTYIPVLSLPISGDYNFTEYHQTVTFTPGDEATDYRVYRTTDIEFLRELLAVSRKARKAFNRRKKQRRARTGRR